VYDKQQGEQQQAQKTTREATKYMHRDEIKGSIQVKPNASKERIEGAIQGKTDKRGR